MILQLATVKIQLIQLISCHDINLTYKTKTDNITEQYVNFVQHDICPEAISLQEIRDKTKSDITLQKVISRMQNQGEEINIENK